MIKSDGCQVQSGRSFAQMGQHYTPQRYLEGFRDPTHPTKPMIWQFDKKHGKWASASIKKVANEPEYYTAQDEILLAQQIERPANQVLDKLRKRHAILDSERTTLVDYIA